MRTTPIAAIEVLLGLLPLHVINEVEAQAAIYRLTCNLQLKPKFTNYGYTKNLGKWSRNLSYLMETDKMLPRYAYHKSFKVQLPDKCKRQNGFYPDNKGGLVWCTDGSETNESTGAGVYRWSSNHTMLFEAEIYAIKACITKKI